MIHKKIENSATFVKRAGLSVGKYGHVCLPKPIYKQLHAAWDNEKTEGVCKVGEASFGCYIDWVESKQVWMLRLQKASLVVSEIGKNSELVFELEVAADSFKLAISESLTDAGAESSTSQEAPRGTKRIAILSFEDARSYVRALGLKSMQDWIDYSKFGYRPIFIPSNPWIAYRGEYSSINDFIGCTSRRRTATLTVKGVGR